MKLVTTAEEVERNILELHQASLKPNDTGYGAYRDLLKRGTCFVPYEAESELAFAPSRFIGYCDNTIRQHSANDDKNGRETNEALEAIYGTRPVENLVLDEIYHSCCRRHGFEANPTGAFGAPRRFWITGAARRAIANADIKEIDTDPNLNSTQKKRLVDARHGQGQFRRDLMTRYDNKCAASGVSHPRLLRASHIKPWSISNNIERLAPANGLLLSAGYDAAFDALLITFRDDGRIILAPDLKTDDARRAGIDVDAHLNAVPPETCVYLAAHRWLFEQRTSNVL